MRIVFVLPNFGAGGAERVASLLCSYWAEQGHTVTAVTFEAAGEQPFYPLAANVTIRQIDTVNRENDLVSRATVNVRRVSRLRAIFVELKPDVIVTFMTEANVVGLWAARGLGIPVVVSERNQPDRPALGRGRRTLRRLTYPRAAAFVAQTEAIAAWAKQRFSIPVFVLPNPVRSLPATEPKAERADIVMAAGRLVRQKGFDLLIDSFARIAPAHPDTKLVIYGEGPERGALEAQIRALPCADRIALPGLCRDLAPAYRQAAIFVLPSRYEGYPNVLLEALASGCPVIAADCPGAAAEILQGEHYGLLVPREDPDALASALDRLLADASLRAAYSALAPEAVAALGVETIGERWLNLLEAASSRGSAQGQVPQA